jgi:hypothetical protein
VREAEEVERVWLAQPARPASFGGIPAELDQPRLVRVQLLPELREPLATLDENRRTSSSCSNPTMKSSTQRTMITSPCPWRRLHQSAHRSKT